MKFTSARISENNSIDGKPGDQTGKEVMEENFYVHELGWYVFEPLHSGEKLAAKALQGARNEKIGYSQKKRLSIIKDTIGSEIATSCDCSSFVRECIIEVYGVDPGNFTTASEVKMLTASGLFKEKYKYTSGEIAIGSVLVSCKKGHTGIITDSNKAVETSVSVETNVPAKCYDKTLAGLYKTTGRLFMRKSPGTGAVMTTMPFGSEVRMYGYYTNHLGTKWFRAQYTNRNNVTYTGFCSERYLIKKGE